MNLTSHNNTYPVDAAACTHTGYQRANNEDSYVFDVANGIYLVADGIGGHPGGEIASDTAVSVAHNALLRDSRLRNAFSKANAAVHLIGSNDPHLFGLGTTLVAMLAHNNSVAISHTGDSRAYLFRGGTLLQLTEDHQSPAGYITHSIGSEPEPFVSMNEMSARRDDLFILCSDGLTNAVNDQDITYWLKKSKTEKTACKNLMDAALDAGGPDNVTIIVVRVR